MRDGGRQAGQPGDAEQSARQRPVARQQQRRQTSDAPQDKEQPPRPGSGEQLQGRELQPQQEQRGRRHQAGAETLAQALQEPYAGVRRRGASLQPQVQAADAEQAGAEAHR